MLAALLLAGLARLTHSPPPPPDGPGTPHFSWDRVPVYNFPCFDPSRKPGLGGPFTDAELELLGKFPLLLLCHGYYDASGTLVRAEEAMTAVATKIKARDPSVKILFYKNSILDWNDYSCHEKLLQRPELWARQANGSATRTHGDTEFVQPPEGMLSVDFAKKEGRDFWMSECLNATRSKMFDGCFADRAPPASPANLDPAEQKAFTAGHAQVLLDTQAGIDALTPGGLLVSNNAYIEGVKSTMLEGFRANNESITQLMQGVAMGVAVLAHGGYSEDCRNMSRGSLAAFLIGTGPGSFFGCSKAWTFRTGWNQWYADYDRPLGAPAGVAKYDSATDTWERSFGQGVRVSFNARTNVGDIDWG